MELLDTTRSGSALTVRLSGELDHDAANQMRGEIDELLTDGGIRNLVLDLKELRFMDSSGVGFVIGRCKKLARRGGAVRVTNADARMRRIFEMSGLYEIVEAQEYGRSK